MVAAVQLTVCLEQSRLLDSLNDAASDYATAAVALTKEISTLDDAAYRHRCFGVEGARLDVQEARDALIRHKADHGC